MRHENSNKHAVVRGAPGSPKAKVRGSNPLGRARKIKKLDRSVFRGLAASNHIAITKPHFGRASQHPDYGVDALGSTLSGSLDTQRRYALWNYKN
jgi:hypothetical protein